MPAVGCKHQSSPAAGLNIFISNKFEVSQNHKITKPQNMRRSKSYKNTGATKSQAHCSVIVVSTRAIGKQIGIGLSLS